MLILHRVEPQVKTLQYMIVHLSQRGCQCFFCL